MSLYIKGFLAARPSLEELKRLHAIEPSWTLAIEHMVREVKSTLLKMPSDFTYTPTQSTLLHASRSLFVRHSGYLVEYLKSRDEASLLDTEVADEIAAVVESALALARSRMPDDLCGCPPCDHLHCAEGCTTTLTGMQALLLLAAKVKNPNTRKLAYSRLEKLDSSLNCALLPLLFTILVDEGENGSLLDSPVLKHVICAANMDERFRNEAYFTFMSSSAPVSRSRSAQQSFLFGMNVFLIELMTHLGAPRVKRNIRAWETAQFMAKSPKNLESAISLVQLPHRPDGIALNVHAVPNMIFDNMTMIKYLIVDHIIADEAYDALTRPRIACSRADDERRALGEEGVQGTRGEQQQQPAQQQQENQQRQEELQRQREEELQRQEEIWRQEEIRRQEEIQRQEEEQQRQEQQEQEQEKDQKQPQQEEQMEEMHEVQHSSSRLSMVSDAPVMTRQMRAKKIAEEVKVIALHGRVALNSSESLDLVFDDDTPAVIAVAEDGNARETIAGTAATSPRPVFTEAAEADIPVSDEVPLDAESPSGSPVIAPTRDEQQGPSSSSSMSRSSAFRQARKMTPLFIPAEDLSSVSRSARHHAPLVAPDITAPHVSAFQIEEGRALLRYGDTRVDVIVTNCVSHVNMILRKAGIDAQISVAPVLTVSHATGICELPLGAVSLHSLLFEQMRKIPDYIISEAAAKGNNLVETQMQRKRYASSVAALLVVAIMLNASDLRASDIYLDGPYLLPLHSMRAFQAGDFGTSTDSIFRILTKDLDVDLHEHIMTVARYNGNHITGKLALKLTSN
jgi:hypothetical protein